MASLTFSYDREAPTKILSRITTYRPSKSSKWNFIQMMPQWTPSCSPDRGLVVISLYCYNYVYYYWKSQPCLRKKPVVVDCIRSMRKVALIIWYPRYFNHWFARPISVLPNCTSRLYNIPGRPWRQRWSILFIIYRCFLAKPAIYSSHAPDHLLG